MSNQTNNKLTNAEIAEILSGVVDGVQPTTHEIAMASELQEYRKASKEPVAITHDMAMAFHSALNDGGIGHEDLEKISIGLRAALANYAAPPLQAVTVPDELTRDTMRQHMMRDDFRDSYRLGWNACRAAMLAPSQQ